MMFSNNKCSKTTTIDVNKCLHWIVNKLYLLLINNNSVLRRVVMSEEVDWYLVVPLILSLCGLFIYTEVKEYNFEYVTNVYLSEPEAYSICNKHNASGLYRFGYNDQDDDGFPSMRFPSGYSNKAVIRCSFFNYQNIARYPDITVRALCATDAYYTDRVLSYIYDFSMNNMMDVGLSLSITKKFLSKIDTGSIRDISYDQNGIPTISTYSGDIKFTQCQSKYFKKTNKKFGENEFYEIISVDANFLAVGIPAIDKTSSSQESVENAFGRSFECISKSMSNKNFSSWKS